MTQLIETIAFGNQIKVFWAKFLKLVINTKAATLAKAATLVWHKIHENSAKQKKFGGTIVEFPNEF